MAYVIGAGDLGACFAVRTATERLALLVGGELRAAAKSDATRLRAGASLAGTGADQLTLKLSQAAEDGEHQASVRGRGVCPGIAQRCEPGACGGDGGKRVEQVAGAAGESVQPRHHQHVSGCEPGKPLAELRTVGVGSAR